MKNIYKLLIITGVFLISLIIVILTSNIISVLKHKDDVYYKIGSNQIPSINKVVGKRKLYYYRSSNNTITIKYKNITNSKSDLNNYINYLTDNYNYYYTSKIDFSNDKGNMQISAYSNNKDEIIIIDIKYDVDNYELVISKKKGTLKLYK